MALLIPIIDSNSFEGKIKRSHLPVVLVFSSETCPACKALLSKLEKICLDYSGQIIFYRILRKQNINMTEKFRIKSVPTMLFFNNGIELSQRLVGNVSTREIFSVLKLFTNRNSGTKEIEKVSSDVLIIGGGPAGLTSAIYSAREGLKTVLIEESFPGGKLLATENITNYPGIKGIIKGKTLAKNMLKQAEVFGAEIRSLEIIQKVFFNDSLKKIFTEDTEYEAKTVIIATGAEPRRLPSEGEETFYGKGIHYCAICDGPLYKNKNIIVVGGGNSALKEALFLSKYVGSITIVHQFDKFQASKIVQEEINKNPKINFVLSSEVRKILGKNSISGIMIQNTNTGDLRELATEGVFVYIGLSPKTDFLKGHLIMDEKGYIVVNENMETNIKGVFSAGDVRKKNIRQITTAVSDGAIAALSAFDYLNS